MRSLEFHFDFGSPNAYLAHRAIPQIEARTGAQFSYVPVLLGGVFKATNNVSPMVALKGIRNKPEYATIATRRWLERYGIEPYQPNPHFPVNTVKIMRGALVAKAGGYFAAYVEAVFGQLWEQGQKMDDPEVIASNLEAANLPAAEIMAGIERPEIKQQLIANTERSVAMGNFGSPTFFLDEEIYFGKDSLRDLEDALLADAGRQAPSAEH